MFHSYLILFLFFFWWADWCLNEKRINGFAANLKPMEFWLRITSIFVQGIQFVWNWQNLTKFDTKWRLKKKCSIIWNIYITLSVILAYSMNFSDWNIQIMAFSFIFVVRNKELFIGIKYPTFGCNVCLFLSYTQI